MNSPTHFRVLFVLFNPPLIACLELVSKIDISINLNLAGAHSLLYVPVERSIRGQLCSTKHFRECLITMVNQLNDQDVIQG